MASYTGTDGKYVIEKLGKGEKIIMCELSNGRVMDCETMTVAAIKSFLPRTDCKWFIVGGDNE